MIYAEILAGGKGTRMGHTSKPKQFLMLGDKPILIHTISRFLENDKIFKVLVCCPKEWIEYTRDLIKKYFKDKEIEVVVGGSTRNETIMNGCKFIEEKYGLNEEDIIITHDAVRPFLTDRIINDNINLLNSNIDAVDTVIPSTDTIVESIDGKLISNIPNRIYMYQGQTPQTFKIKKLLNIYNLLTNEEKDILTDACKIFSIKGYNVGLVNGEPFNIKITNRSDLQMASAILSEMELCSEKRNDI